jgi:hypothetical protein
MPLLFWYPMIVWSSMIGLALDGAQPMRTKSADASADEPES